MLYLFFLFSLSNPSASFLHLLLALDILHFCVIAPSVFARLLSAYSILALTPSLMPNFLSVHLISSVWFNVRGPISFPLPLLLSLNPIIPRPFLLIISPILFNLPCFLYLFSRWWFVSFSTFVPFFFHLLYPASAPLSSYIPSAVKSFLAVVCMETDTTELNYMIEISAWEEEHLKKSEFLNLHKIWKN